MKRKLPKNLKILIDALEDAGIKPTCQPDGNSVGIYFASGTGSKKVNGKNLKFSGVTMSLVDHGDFVELTGIASQITSMDDEGMATQAVCVPKTKIDKVSTLLLLINSGLPKLHMRIGPCDGHFAVCINIEKRDIQENFTGKNAGDNILELLVRHLGATCFVAASVDKVVGGERDIMRVANHCLDTVEQIGKTIGCEIKRLRNATKEDIENILKGKEPKKTKVVGEIKAEEKKKPNRKKTKKEEKEDESPSEYFSHMSRRRKRSRDEDYDDDYDDEDDDDDDDEE